MILLEEEESDPPAPAVELEGVLDEEEEVATNELVIESVRRAVVVVGVEEVFDNVVAGVEEKDKVADVEGVTETTVVGEVIEEEDTVEEPEVVVEVLGCDGGVTP